VRQLNKYDFHKVKNTDDNQFGEHVRLSFRFISPLLLYNSIPSSQSSIFRHPDFHAGRRDALENIERKVPAQRKTTLAAAALAAAAAQQTSPSNPSGGSYPAAAGGVGGRSPSPTHTHLTAEIQRLKDEGEDLRGRIRVLERNYENVLVEMVGFQRGMAMMFNFGSASFSSDATDAFNNIPMNTIDEHEGLQVYIAGHLLPRNAGGDNTQGSWTFDASGLATGALGGLGIGGVEAAGASSSSALECMYSEEETVQPTLSNALITTGSSSTFSSGSLSTVSVSGGSPGQKFRVQKSTFVPGWVVPPRVLIVDDDVVTRQLSSKFLKVFGCATEVAVDWFLW
jgi:osomolarity two-component system response regulator SKN7